MKFLLLIDTFGRNPHFLIKKNPKIFSAFGGIMTIALYIVAGISLLFFGQELIYRTNPSVNLSSKSTNHPEEIPYFNNYEFMIGLRNTAGEILINERIYRMEATITEIVPLDEDGHNFYQMTEINLERCNETYKDLNFNGTFGRLDLPNYYCISRNQSKPLEYYGIKEYGGNSNFKSIEVQVLDCVDPDEEGICEDKSFIDYYLGMASLHWVMLDKLVDTRNHKHPFQPSLRENNFYVSNAYTLQMSQYIKHLNIYSDDGYIFTTQNEQKTFQLDFITESTVYYRILPFFASITIQLSNNIEEFHRNYYKLQDLAAQVGGVFETISFALGLVTFFYTEHNLYEYLINKFFEIKINEDKKSKKSSHHLKFKKEEELSPKESNQQAWPNSVQITTLNATYRSTTLSALQLKKKKNNKIILNFFDKVVFLTFLPKAYCAKNHRVNTLYKQGKEEIENFLETDKALHRFHSSNMLENLLMNEPQRKMFDYIFNPVLNYNFFGTRFNSRNLPIKTKEKILGRTVGGHRLSTKEMIQFDMQTKNNSWSN